MEQRVSAAGAGGCPEARWVRQSQRIGGVKWADGGEGGTVKVKDDQ